MVTASITSCCSSWRTHPQLNPRHRHRHRRHMVVHSSSDKSKVSAVPRENGFVDEQSESSSGFLKRRQALVSGICLISSAVLGFPREGAAAVKQGPLAGRIPGLSEPDEQDLGGTEIDLRFASPKEGRLFVIVAPVLRFADNLGDDAKIERIGPPEKVISAFGPEVIGENVEGKVISMEVTEHSGRKYYQFELEPPHALITATAAGNRLYLFNITANGLQWKRHYNDLKKIADSFRVV